MNKPTQNLHQGHRMRLQNRYALGGADGLSDHNLLELLLFYSIPRVDTNETAHRLLEKFGTLEGVSRADINELMSVRGVGEKTAQHIKLIFDIQNRINEQRCDGKRNMLVYENVKDFLISRMSKYNDEVVMLLMLNSRGELIRSCFVGIGGKKAVNVDIRKIIEIAYACSASGVITAHNHPDGPLIPSQEDVATTAHLYSSLKELKLNLSEHYIVNSRGVVGILKYVCDNREAEIQKMIDNDRGAYDD